MFAIPIVFVLLIGGVWVTGGLITDDFKLSMGLTTAWIVLLGAGCLRLAFRRRELAPHLVGSYLVAAALVGGYLAMSLLFDEEVNERVVMADIPARNIVNLETKRTAPPARPAAPRNVLIGRGQFQGVNGPGHGTASTIDRARGGRVLTLTNFEVENGPDLRVLLVAGPAIGAGDIGDHKDLGALKGKHRKPAVHDPRGAGPRPLPPGRHLVPRVLGELRAGGVARGLVGLAFGRSRADGNHADTLVYGRWAIRFRPPRRMRSFRGSLARDAIVVGRAPPATAEWRRSRGRPSSDLPACAQAPAGRSRETIRGSKADSPLW